MLLVGVKSLQSDMTELLGKHVEWVAFADEAALSPRIVVAVRTFDRLWWWREGVREQEIVSL